MEKTVTIKLKPYLQQFYTNLGKSDKVNTSLKGVLGSVIVIFLARQPRDYVPPRYSGDEYLEVGLKYIDSKTGPDIRGNVYVPEKHFKTIERLLKTIFEAIYFNYMDRWLLNKTVKNNRILGSYVSDGILAFCIENNISYADAFENLKKKYYRERRCRNNSSNYKKNEDLFRESVPEQIQSYVHQLVLNI